MRQGRSGGTEVQCGRATEQVDVAPFFLFANCGSASARARSRNAGRSRRGYLSCSPSLDSGALVASTWTDWQPRQLMNDRLDGTLLAAARGDFPRRKEAYER